MTHHLPRAAFGSCLTIVLLASAACVSGADPECEGDACAVGEIGLANKVDEHLEVQLSLETPSKWFRVRCEGEDGCRVELRMLNERTDWIRDQPAGDIEVFTVLLEQPDGGGFESTFIETRSGGGYGSRNDVLDFEVPMGESRLTFAMGLEPLEARVSLSVVSGQIASPEVRQLCVDACDYYDVQGCTPPRLREACHAGCDVIFEEEAAVFVECAVDAFDCDTFCFYALPRVVRYSGGCEPTEDREDRCPSEMECVANVCVGETGI